MISADRLHWILVKAATSRRMSKWDENFIADIQQQFDMVGEEIVLTDVQEEHLERIADQATY